MATKKKSFDAVKSSRLWRRQVSRLVRDMSPEQRIAFFNGTRLAGAVSSRVKSARI